MRLTTNHSDSKNGIPVFIDEQNNVMSVRDGVRALRKKMGMNTTDFGKRVGVSARTVEDWEQGRRNPSSAVLLLMKQFAK